MLGSGSTESGACEGRPRDSGGSGAGVDRGDVHPDHVLEELAQSLATRELDAAGESATTYANLGETHEEAGDLDKATWCYEQALSTRPEIRSGPYQPGEHAAKTKEIRSGGGGIRGHRSGRTDSAAGHTNLGILYRQLNRLDDAAREFEEACRHGSDPERSSAFVNLGSLREKRESYSLAADCYREALKLQPDNAQACAGLGVAMIHQGQDADGLKWLRQAVEVDPGFEQGHTLLGKALLLRKDLDGAARQFDQVIKLNPKQASGWYSLGLVRGRQERLVEAADCFARAVECDPRSADSRRAPQGNTRSAAPGRATRHREPNRATPSPPLTAALRKCASFAAARVSERSCRVGAVKRFLYSGTSPPAGTISVPETSCSRTHPSCRAGMQV